MIKSEFPDGYTTDDIEFFWKAISSPVQLANISMPRFRLEGIKTGYCTSITATGKTFQQKTCRATLYTLGILVIDLHTSVQ